MTKRTITLLAVVFGIAMAPPADEPTVDDTIQQFSQDLTKLVSLLKDVKDQATALAARDQLIATDKSLAATFERIQKLKSQPGEAGMKKLAGIEQQWDELEKQLTRIAAIPTAANLLDRLPTSKSLVNHRRDGRAQAARVSALNLTKAAQAYEIKFGQPPASLLSLVAPPDGGRPYIEGGQNALFDPWGRPFQYDPAGPKNNGLKPDIWSLGPDPNDKTKFIGNWPEDKKAAPDKKGK
jgi:Type II secretion system (T2SS), protein G